MWLQPDPRHDEDAPPDPGREITAPVVSPAEAQGGASADPPSGFIPDLQQALLPGSSVPADAAAAAAARLNIQPVRVRMDLPGAPMDPDAGPEALQDAQRAEVGGDSEAPGGSLLPPGTFQDGPQAAPGERSLRPTGSGFSQLAPVVSRQPPSWLRCL